MAVDYLPNLGAVTTDGVAQDPFYVLPPAFYSDEIRIEQDPEQSYTMQTYEASLVTHPNGSQHVTPSCSEEYLPWRSEMNGFDSQNENHGAYGYSSFSQVGPYVVHPCIGAGDGMQRPAVLEQATIDQTRRERRCLGCQDDSGNRYCIGFPLCQKCIKTTGLRSPPSRLTKASYLNWKLWFSVCQSLGEHVPSKWKISDELPSYTVGEEDSVIIEAEFEDRGTQRNIRRTRSIVYAPWLRGTQTDPFGPRADDDGVRIRQPAISLSQFDDFVKDSMLAKLYPSEPGPRLSKDEHTLQSAVTFFTGYFSLLSNLKSTWIDCTAFLADTISRRIAAEMIYLVVFRLVMLFSKIVSLIESLQQKNSHQNHPGIALQALEVMYRAMKSTQSTSWNVPETHVLHPLRELEQDFLEKSSVMHNHIQAFQCYLSGIDKLAYRTRLPLINRFTRGDGNKCFPCHLLVTVHKHKPWGPGSVYFGFNPFPLIGAGQTGRSVIDLLSNSDQDMTTDILNGAIIPRPRLPEYLVNEDNTKVIRQMATLEYEVQHCSRDTMTSIGGPTFQTSDDCRAFYVPRAPRSHADTIDSSVSDAESSLECQVFRNGWQGLLEKEHPQIIPAWLFNQSNSLDSADDHVCDKPNHRRDEALARALGKRKSTRIGPESQSEPGPIQPFHATKRLMASYGGIWTGPGKEDLQVEVEAGDEFDMQGSEQVDEDPQYPAYNIVTFMDV
ncbi:hypothetical protein LTS15_006672 [Exophiala xenobiotica]|nr:hypothetical protein LTS15_006672 [Exophiala xenobiotica]